MLSQDERLKKKADYDEVFKYGNKARGSNFLSVIRLKEDGKTRVGIITKRALGKAVIRNRIKRRLRGAYQKIKSEIESRADIILIPNVGVLKVEFSQLVTDLRNIFQKLMLL
ncbi:MAG: ribonuclease P protein component [bacterium]